MNFTIHQYNSRINNYYNNNFKYIVGLIFLFRLVYIIFSDNYTGDVRLYREIANGISAGCGYGVLDIDGNCKTVVGHFFPGFHYLLSLFYSINFGVKGLVIFVSFVQFSSFIYLYSVIKKHTHNNKLAKNILFLTSLSPLTLGFTRLMLIEPIITALSTFFLAQIIVIYYEGFTRRNLTLLLIIQII